MTDLSLREHQRDQPGRPARSRLRGRSFQLRRALALLDADETPRAALPLRRGQRRTHAGLLLVTERRLIWVNRSPLRRRGLSIALSSIACTTLEQPAVAPARLRIDTASGPHYFTSVEPGQHDLLRLRSLSDPLAD